MTNVSKFQFLDMLGNCRKIGFMADIEVSTGRAELSSRQKLDGITSKEVEIQLFESPFFRTYDLIYYEKMQKRAARVLLME